MISFLLISGKSFAITDEETDPLEINDLIMNETVSRFGQEFYDYFSSRWQPFLGQSIAIAITERVGFQPMLLVSVNDNMVYTKIVSPRSYDLEEASKDAIKAVKMFLIQGAKIDKELMMY